MPYYKSMTIQPVQFVDDNGNPINTGISVLQEQKTEADAIDGVVTFGEVISTLEIYNLDDVDGTFQVNGLNVKVPAGSPPFIAVFQGPTPSNQVTVTGSENYILNRYGGM